MKYELVRSGRRTVCLEAKSGLLVVRAPYLASRFIIEKFIAEKSEWIEKTLEKSKIVKKEIRKYESGEKYLYLGEYKKLEIENAGEIRVCDGSILVPAENEVEIKTKLRKFYKAETARLVKKYVSRYSDKFNIDSPKITYKFYKSKWGSCSAKNDFSFNALLSMASEKAVKYVVIHELVHAKVKNHSKKFWYEIEKFDPNYKIQRKWLRENHHKMSL
ncbi:MAG: SprT family zinc-dependent metalloprotease [Candidatus Subteraquimicrobiales bacterium]|nr:SprT family zinc-dependent metalloprotease [Candidatus Subteraquimicrobiales bacterium]